MARGTANKVKQQQQKGTAGQGNHSNGSKAGVGVKAQAHAEVEAEEHVAEEGQIDEVVEQFIEDSESLPDIETYERQHRVQMEKYKLKTLISTWKQEQTAERSLRTTYGLWLLRLLTGEVIFAGAVLFALGFGWIQLTDWQANVFFVAIFSKIAAMVWLVLKYLFPSSGDKVHKLIEKL